MEDFTRTIQKLGDGSGNTLQALSPVPTGISSAREARTEKAVSKAVQIVSSLPGQPNIPLPVSRLANCGTPTTPPNPVSEFISHVVKYRSSAK